MSILNIEEKFEEIFSMTMDENEVFEFLDSLNYINNNMINELIINKFQNSNFINYFPHSYKNTRYYNFFNFLIDFLNVNINLKNADKVLASLLLNLVKTDKGQHFIKRLQRLEKFNNCMNQNITQLLEVSAIGGTLPTFLYVMHFNINKSLYSHNYKKINGNFPQSYKDFVTKYFLLSLKNSDDRIYKYFLNDKTYLEIIKAYKTKDFNYIFRCLSSISSIFYNVKYYLKRIKTLDNFLNIKPHVINSYNHISFNQFLTIIPFYSNKLFFSNLTLNQIAEITNNFDFWDNVSEEPIEEFRQKFIEKINKFSDKISIQNLKLLLFHQFDDNTIYDNSFVCKYITINGLNDNLVGNKIFIQLLNDNFVENPIKLKDLGHIYNHRYVLLNRCIIHPEIKKLNIIKKFFYKILNIQYKTKEFIENYNNNIIFTDDFTTIPPKHLLNNNINEKVLMRPKADGYLVNTIDSHVYPENIISNYMVKAEYIEAYNLYLVFDINIGGMNTIDRYNYLRQLHPVTSNTKIQHISSLDDIKNINMVEDSLLSQFIKNNKQTKWYPKLSFTIDITSSMIDILLSSSEFNKKYHNSIYSTDGFVINYKMTELKIKPLDFMTIDILYRDNHWYNREGEIIDNYISGKNMYNNIIYRCYPIIDSNGVMFQPKEIRNDKNKANPSYVINEIIYYLESKNTYYQKKVQPSDNNLLIVKRQRKRFDDIISKYYIKTKSWLDLGCGKGNLIKHLKDIIIYFGVDNDNRVISKNINRFDNNRVIFKNSDLSKKIDCIPPLKFDYIVINHSINHFYSEEFLLTIEKHSKEGTILIFNITNNNLKNKRIEIDGGYIENKYNKTEYYFPWIHNNIVHEKFINIDKVKNNFSNFKIIEENIFSDTEFESIYTWFVMKKK